jgi:hypothetical protein
MKNMVCGLVATLLFASPAFADTNLSTIMSNGTGMTCTGTGSTQTCSTGVPTATTSQVYGGTGTAGSAAAVSLGNALAITSGVLNTTMPINAQGSNNYTVVATDANKLITQSNTTALTLTVPTAGGTGFGAGVSFCHANLGAGPVTITPVSGTIGGKSSLVVYQSAGVCLVSDGSNWDPIGSGLSQFNLVAGGGTLNNMTSMSVGATATNPLNVSYAGADGTTPVTFNSSGSTLSSSATVRITLTATSSNLNGNALQIINNGDAASWFVLGRDVSNAGTNVLGGFAIGPGGSGARDTWIYRSGAQEITLATGGAYSNAGIKVSGTGSTSQQVAIGNVSYAGTLNVGGTIKTLGYTVSTLPTGTIGMRAYVTDATACSLNGSLTGSGSTFCPVIYNGSAWVGG